MFKTCLKQVKIGLKPILTQKPSDVKIGLKQVKIGFKPGGKNQCVNYDCDACSHHVHTTSHVIFDTCYLNDNLT